MYLRTLTCLLDPGFPVESNRLAQGAQVVAQLRAGLEKLGYGVQTTRLACPPPAETLQGDATALPAYAAALAAAAQHYGFDYVALGPARPGDPPAFYTQIPAALATAPTVFATASLTAGQQLDFAAVRAAAAIIHRCATLTPDGFGNLRFAALARVPAGIPFFPAAYHTAGAPLTIAIGVEAAELAVTACHAPTLAEARATLIQQVEAHAQTIAQAFPTTAAQFGGLDFTFAPYPEPARSIGTALERLTGAPVGARSTVAAAAFLTDALDHAQFPRAGFSGLFFPVFEDSVLAQRAAEGTLTISDLLLYSTVCGSGLDTVPLPGDVTPNQLAAILADVGALALRLHKPLTARLMPIPGLQVGDPVSFDFPFFAPTRVLAPQTTGLSGLLGRAEGMEIHKKSSVISEQ